jgi:hypothetical protein
VIKQNTGRPSHCFDRRTAEKARSSDSWNRAAPIDFSVDHREIKTAAGSISKPVAAIAGVLFCTAEHSSVTYTGAPFGENSFPIASKGNHVDIQSKLKPVLLGAAVGAIAVAVIGFNWGGWVTASGAKMATQQAIVASLAPICVSQFQRSADAVIRQAEMKKIGMWDQSSFVEKAGWATMPGSTEPDSAVAKACAGLIGNLKL